MAFDQLVPERGVPPRFDARNWAFREDRLNAGAFVAKDQMRGVGPELLSESREHGQYHWWEFQFA